MHINERGVLSEDISISISEKSQNEVDARLYFMQNPYDLELLTNILLEASEMGMLEISKKSNIRKIMSNPFVDYDLKQLIDKSIIDKDRLKALEIIKNFKPVNPGE